MTYVVRPVLEVLIWPLPRFSIGIWNCSHNEVFLYVSYYSIHHGKQAFLSNLHENIIQLAEIYLEEFYQTYSIWILLQTICAIASDTFRLIPSLTNFIRKGCNIIETMFQLILYIGRFLN